MKTLYFHNLDNYAGVFDFLVHEAEEEECKEMILAYYFLLAGKNRDGLPFTLEELDDRIEEWMSGKYGISMDFEVKDAVRIDNSGVFVHSAPWSIEAQGNSNVSHGCVNLSPENAKWFFDNFGSGDPVVIKGTGGGWYNQPDGASDWQMF